jgi:hypothetical protein
LQIANCSGSNWAEAGVAIAKLPITAAITFVGCPRASAYRRLRARDSAPKGDGFLSKQRTARRRSGLGGIALSWQVIALAALGRRAGGSALRILVAESGDLVSVLITNHFPFAFSLPQKETEGYAQPMSARFDRRYRSSQLRSNFERSCVFKHELSQQLVFVRRPSITGVCH